jgi:hypothetical protein
MMQSMRAPIGVRPLIVKNPNRFNNYQKEFLGVLPIEHFIVAFLPLLGYILLRDRRLPTPKVTALIFVGSQFPNLVDKPLSHQFDLLPSGRVFLHSLPVAMPFLTLVVYYGWRTERPRVTAVFAVAHLSHLLADNYKPLLDSSTVSPDLL